VVETHGLRSMSFRPLSGCRMPYSRLMKPRGSVAPGNNKVVHALASSVGGQVCESTTFTHGLCNSSHMQTASRSGTCSQSRRLASKSVCQSARACASCRWAEPTIVAKVRISGRQSSTAHRPTCPDPLGQDRHALTIDRKLCEAHGVTLTR